MKLFQGNPQAALDKTRAKLGSVDENLADLRARRAETLLSAEDADAVVAIDKAIDAELVNAAIYKDRIKALQEECRKITYQEREGQRAKAIEKIKERLAKRETLATELQLAIARVGHLYSELMQNDEIESLWPFPRPGFGFGQIDHRGVRREIGWQLHGLVNQFHLPEPSSVGLGVVGVRSIGVDGAVREQNEAIISRLEFAPIADDLLDEAV